MRIRPVFTAVALLIAFAIPTSAWAFCGFYVGGGDAKLFNDATQVVLMRGGNTTILSMQNKYEGPAQDFAMVVPVPQVLSEDNVKTLRKEVFDTVDTLSAPRLVEYWERDPCMKPGGLADFGSIGIGGLGMRGSGMGGGGMSVGRGYVEVRAQFAVGEYDIEILETNDAATLESWLKSNKYKIPEGAAPYFKPYIESGMYFFVAKVNLEKAKYENGKAVLSPLRFHYESEEFTLPIRLGMINSKGKQDLLVYILAENQRYEVANYPNVTIPTNIEVSPRIKSRFGGFYEALLSKTLEENPKAVVTEYAWQAMKCDPCPSGIRGGRGLMNQDLASLGNDVLKKSINPWNNRGFTLTRLHARYPKDGVGEDLVFKKADAILGGREVRKEDGSLEKGTTEGSFNNFQGRYIIRNEWEGKVECEKPQRGIWGGPPANANLMSTVADAIVTEMRRSAAAKEGRDVTEEELEKPWTRAEEEAVAFQMRRRFGTSHAPSGPGGAAAAPSMNTRGGGAPTLSQPIGTLLKEPIPEVKLKPEEPKAEPAAEAGGAKPEEAAPAETEAPKQKEPKGSGCTAVPGSPSPGAALLWLVGLFLVIRRRR